MSSLYIRFLLPSVASFLFGLYVVAVVLISVQHSTQLTIIKTALPQRLFVRLLQPTYTFIFLNLTHCKGKSLLPCPDVSCISRVRVSIRGKHSAS